MTTEKMTIHKALSELKILDARITDAISGTTFCVANKHSNTKIKGISVGEFVNGMRADYDKSTDLIKRRAAIKRAVVLSNARTEVQINGVPYTVAEAIEMKQHGVVLKKVMLDEMVRQYRKALVEIQKNNGDELDKRAEQYVIGLFGSRDGRTDTEDFKRAKQDFIDNQMYELIDPLKIKTQIDALEKEISDFMTEVDGALSTSNALTLIEISY